MTLEILIDLNTQKNAAEIKKIIVKSAIDGLARF